ncbi:MAG: protein adenylyltransferase SelO family protein, partial [Cyanobacteriota bacterium]
LSAVIPVAEMDVALSKFAEHYNQTYTARMIGKLGFENLPNLAAEELVMQTLKLLVETQVSYHGFFWEVTKQFDRNWRDDATNILKADGFLNAPEATALLEDWRNLYLQTLLSFPDSDLDNIAARLRRHNPKTALVRPEIEAVWEKIDQEDNWTPFYELIEQLRFHKNAIA